MDLREDLPQREALGNRGQLEEVPAAVGLQQGALPVQVGPHELKEAVLLGCGGGPADAVPRAPLRVQLQLIPGPILLLDVDGTAQAPQAAHSLNGQPVAQGLGFLHGVGGHNHRLVRGSTLDHLPQVALGRSIHSSRRLIQKQDVTGPYQRHRHGKLPLHAPRVLAGWLIRVRPVQAQAGEEAVGLGGGVGLGDALGHGVELHMVKPTQGGPQWINLRAVPQVLVRLEHPLRVHRIPRHVHLPRRGRADLPGQARKRGGLPRAVRAQQPEALPGLHRQGDVPHGVDRAIFGGVGVVQAAVHARHLGGVHLLHPRSLLHHVLVHLLGNRGRGLGRLGAARIHEDQQSPQRCSHPKRSNDGDQDLPMRNPLKHRLVANDSAVVALVGQDPQPQQHPSHGVEREEQAENHVQRRGHRRVRHGLDQGQPHNVHGQTGHNSKHNIQQRDGLHRNLHVVEQPGAVVGEAQHRQRYEEGHHPDDWALPFFHKFLIQQGAHEGNAHRHNHQHQVVLQGVPGPVSGGRHPLGNHHMLGLGHLVGDDTQSEHNCWDTHHQPRRQGTGAVQEISPGLPAIAGKHVVHDKGNGENHGAPEGPLVVQGHPPLELDDSADVVTPGDLLALVRHSVHSDLLEIHRHLPTLLHLPLLLPLPQLHEHLLQARHRQLVVHHPQLLRPLLQLLQQRAEPLQRREGQGKRRQLGPVPALDPLLLGNLLVRRSGDVPADQVADGAGLLLAGTVREEHAEVVPLPELHLEFTGGPAGEHAALGQDGLPVGEDVGFFQVVGGEDDGAAALLHGDQQLPQLTPRRRVHSTRGLV
mmetsp:Transcript_54289/g.118998  ORF Transcript_54289/g.118998 Transcript_54289/m.118998 type:complete len:810 (+) Transcript_54289:196-2625(+)